jgi:hypothetical protein
MAYVATLEHKADSYIDLYLPPRIMIGVRGWTARTALKTRGPANVMNYTQSNRATTWMLTVIMCNWHMPINENDSDSASGRRGKKGSYPTSKKKSGSSLIASANYVTYINGSH